jgi:hypothetical protein
MAGLLQITKEEMVRGLAQKRTLVQEEWADAQEIKWVDELIAEGKATATTWEYKANFQCERRIIVGLG